MATKGEEPGQTERWRWDEMKGGTRRSCFLWVVWGRVGAVDGVHNAVGGTWAGEYIQNKTNPPCQLRRLGRSQSLQDGTKHPEYLHFTPLRSEHTVFSRPESIMGQSPFDSSSRGGWMLWSAPRLPRIPVLPVPKCPFDRIREGMAKVGSGEFEGSMLFTHTARRYKEGQISRRYSIE